MRRRIAYHSTDRPRAEGAGTIAALRSWEGSARRARARLAARDEAGGGERVGWEGHTPREPLHGDRLTESADEAVAAFWDHLLKGERSAYEIGLDGAGSLSTRASQGRVRRDATMWGR